MISGGNDSTSTIIDLENLQKQYSNLLISYKAAVTEYLYHINHNLTDPSFVQIKGYMYNGTGSAGVSSATTLQDCIASCSKSKSCTGATFVSNKCSIRTGNSPLFPSSNNSIAIIPKSQQLLMNMESINEQLLIVNKKLNEKIKQTEPVYDKADKETYIKNNELIKSYEKLLEERKYIDNLLEQYKTLDNSQNETDIKINQNYYMYIVLLIFVVIIISFLYVFFYTKNSIQQNIQSGGDLNKNSYIILLAIIFTIFLVNYFYK
jgi:PAN domain